MLGLGELEQVPQHQRLSHDMLARPREPVEQVEASGAGVLLAFEHGTLECVELLACVDAVARGVEVVGPNGKDLTGG